MQKGVLIPVLIVLFGLLLLLKNLFNWNISIFRIFVGIAIVVVGISLLTGGLNWFRNGFRSYGQSSSNSSINSSNESINSSNESINSSNNSGGSSGSFHEGAPAGHVETVSFGERHYTATQSGKFTFAFASGSIDLTKLEEGQQYRIQVDSVFSGVNIYVKPGMGVAVQGSSAFGKIQLPNGNAAFFGDISQGSTSGITLVASAAFGSINVYEKS